MIDETLVSAVRDRLKKLLPYRRQVRPAIPASFPSFVDGELLRLDTTTRDIVGGLQALDPILEALTVDQGGGGGSLPEAPVDGTPYARQDAAWTPVATIRGEPGSPGEPGQPGVPGKNGADGKDGKDGADFPDAPIDGKLYARKDGDWATFTPGSAGGSAPAAPKIVQVASGRNPGGAVAKFAQPVTKGNVIVLFCSGYSAGKNFPSGFSALQSASAPNNAIHTAYKIADGTEGAQFSVTSSDFVNMTAYELSGVGSYQGGGYSMGSPSFYLLQLFKLPGTGTLTLFGLESDNGSTFSKTDTVPRLYEWQAGGGGNHYGYHAAIEQQSLAILRGDITSPRDVVVAWLQFGA